MSRPVLILGCGPAGLFAAQAATTLGFEVDILSAKRKSEMFGAQYLHAPIPRLNYQPARSIVYMLRGTSDEYAHKVYGPQPPESVSPKLLVGIQPAWDIREAYNKAWERFNRLIINTGKLSLRDIDQVSKSTPRYMAIISTIPATTLCHDSELHTFLARDVWASGDAPERGSICPISIPYKNTVICDGTENVSWYRAANVFGYNTAEWATEAKPPYDNVSQITKPIRTNCDCFPNIIRLGRYGRWEKGYLSHRAYADTIEHLKGL